MYNNIFQAKVYIYIYIFSLSSEPFFFLIYFRLPLSFAHGRTRLYYFLAFAVVVPRTNSLPPPGRPCSSARSDVLKRLRFLYRHVGKRVYNPAIVVRALRRPLLRDGVKKYETTLTPTICEHAMSSRPRVIRCNRPCVYLYTYT